MNKVSDCSYKQAVSSHTCQIWQRQIPDGTRTCHAKQWPTPPSGFTLPSGCNQIELLFHISKWFVLCVYLCIMWITMLHFKAVCTTEYFAYHMNDYFTFQSGLHCGVFAYHMNDYSAFQTVCVVRVFVYHMNDCSVFQSILVCWVVVIIEINYCSAFQSGLDCGVVIIKFNDYSAFQSVQIVECL